ncbi:DUF2147 domain-containing protein [Penaeicola halotolerans]|uniref:DUF2147 domain-containing protein n=1 Tax=Penaeicola halotolerans TaxID=2793196 RepID=UPI001CF7F856|nr:DUF2147 domain-containing protein [Penaeicola halotolerans]
MTKIKFTFAFLGLFLIASSALMAQSADAIVGTWFNTEREAKIEIYKEAGKYNGKIVWLKEPTENGKPKLDKNNSNASLRKRPLMGLNLLKGFVYEDGVWEDGEIYDPKNGKTYSCVIKRKNDKVLEVRGYIGFSMIGRTVEWYKAD